MRGRVEKKDSERAQHAVGQKEDEKWGECRVVYRRLRGRERGCLPDHARANRGGRVQRSKEETEYRYSNCERVGRRDETFKKKGGDRRNASILTSR